MQIKEIKTVDQHAQTLEGLISKLDERGLLVFTVLIGQQAMKLLEKKHVDTVTGSSILTKPKILKVN